MADKSIDQVNLFKLMHYMQESKLARKADGYTEHLQEQMEKDKKTLPVLMHVQAFLSTLTNPSAEGRFFCEAVENDSVLKYVLLDPTEAFKDVVEDARAVILAGGTMSPMEDYTSHLFHYLPADRIMTLSCGHVIPPENLLAMTVSRGPQKVNFDFKYEQRKSATMISELGEAIAENASVVPDGMVIFFPSYAYLNSIVSLWKSTKTWNNINTHKRIFIEPKSQQPVSQSTNQDQELNTVDKVLTAYTARIQAPDRLGAILLAVIGGSLSEGINFSDALGRCIIVVGLPFPNIQSPEWKAKLEFVQQRTGRRDAGREFLENACTRAVNQSVGRAIRHRNDYAAILLFDIRYGGTISGKLPKWIQRSLVKDAGLDGVMDGLKGFFGKKR